VQLSDSHCALCGPADREPFHGEGGFAYVRCRSCGLVYLSPRPADPDITEHYQTYLPEEAGDIAAWRTSMAPLFRRTAAILERRCGGTGRILDVGTGFGFFVRLMADRGWEALGLEISRPAVTYARETLGVEVLDRPLEEARLPRGSFDAVTAFYVVEHLPDPLAACRAMRALLKPGGVLVLRWPHSAPLVKWLAAFRLDLGLMHAPSHLWQFSPATMQTLLARAGFTGVETTVGGWTWPADPLWRMAGVGGGAAAWGLERLTGGRLLLPGVSKTTIACTVP